MANAELQQNGQYFVNYCPDYIGLDQAHAFKDASWQLILIDLLPLEMFAEIHISKIAQNKKSYLHFELYEHYKANECSTIINGFKENTFALGLMVLEMAFDIDIQNLHEENFQMLKSAALTG